MISAPQLTQEQVIEELVSQQILERHAAPPMRAIQVIGTEGPEFSFVFSMLRDPDAGILTWDGWKITGTLEQRREVQRQIKNRIGSK